MKQLTQILSVDESPTLSTNFLKPTRALVLSRFYTKIGKLKKAQVFYCEFWEIFKNSYSYRTPQVTASRKNQEFFLSFCWLGAKIDIFSPSVC